MRLIRAGDTRGGMFRDCRVKGKRGERADGVSSKLGNILFTRELASRLEKRGASKVYANCFFPGK